MKTSFNLPLPKHFSFAQCLAFLGRGYDDCLYRLAPNSVRRMLHFSDGDGLLSIEEGKGLLQVELFKDDISTADLTQAKEFVSDWFDLRRDISPFYDLLRQEPSVAHFPSDFSGARLIGIPDLFEAICWAIMGQQINLAFAYRMKRSLTERYGGRTQIDGQVYYTFPSPKAMGQADRETLIAMQFSRQKIDYLQVISQAFLNQEIGKFTLRNCRDKAERIKRLTSIKGIGPWTANYVLMKTMRDMNCITYGDAGLNKALHNIYQSPKKPTRSQVDKLFTPFHGWESYFNFYLWLSLGPL